jgi:hypothetical protein
MKPGWKTTEFWTTAISQLFALLVMVGVLSGGDSAQLEAAVVKCVTAIGALVTNALVIFRYIDGRIRLKTQQPAAAKPGFGAGLALLAALCLASAAPAAEPTPAYLLPWRDQIDKRLQNLERKRPPEIEEHRLMRPEEADALRRRIAELELELHKLRIGYYTPPKQDLPIPGVPKQELPIPGQPKQDLPLPGGPKQELPGPGLPKQDLSPRAPLPELGPKQLLPVGPPNGYQRFTGKAPIVLPPDIRHRISSRPPEIITAPAWR